MIRSGSSAKSPHSGSSQPSMSIMIQRSATSCSDGKIPSLAILRRRMRCCGSLAIAVRACSVSSPRTMKARGSRRMTSSVVDRSSSEATGRTSAVNQPPALKSLILVHAFRIGFHRQCLVATWYGPAVRSTVI